MQVHFSSIMWRFRVLKWIKIFNKLTRTQYDAIWIEIQTRGSSYLRQMQNSNDCWLIVIPFDRGDACLSPHHWVWPISTNLKEPITPTFRNSEDLLVYLCTVLFVIPNETPNKLYIPTVWCGESFHSLESPEPKGWTQRHGKDGARCISPLLFGTAL